MKKSLTLFLAMTFALLMLSGCNEKKNEPASPDTPSSDVRVRAITLSKTSYVFTAKGQTLQLEATVIPADATNPKVTWKSSNTAVMTVSDNGLVTCSDFGDAIITATADSKTATCMVSAYKDYVSDACENIYRIVKIGEQWWMAENMRCNKYDTDSERPNATISTSSIEKDFAPYYIDASNKNNWNYSDDAEALSEWQIAKLGYLYNWAATVGFATADEARAQKEEFTGNRQGICPNGWHVPKESEFIALEQYLGDKISLGKRLKTKSGWCENGNGTDEYSFSVLPAGQCAGGGVYSVGSVSYIQTSTPTITQDGVEFAANRHFAYSDPQLFDGYSGIYYAHSVRCVKN